MNSIKLFSLGLLLIVSSSALSQKLDQSLWNSGINYSRYSEANTELLKKGIKPTAVLMGDSITDGWINNHPEFFEENNLVDRGISGETTGQMLLRFREDVINLRPKVVVILAGINDIAENSGPIGIEKVYGNIISMVQLAQLNKIKAVICKLVPANRFPWRERINPTEKVKALNKMLEDYALVNHVDLVDYFEPMADENRGLRSDLGSDGVHPNSKGYRIMEPLLLIGIHDAINEY